MLSVIIPTVQKKLEVLKILVGLLDKDSSVSEIFIINNKPSVPLNLSGDKLTIYTPEENLYVNPSWNLGITKIKNENFVLLNDDLLVCKDFCKMVVESEIFNDAQTGLIGIFPGAIQQFSNVDYIEIPFSECTEPEFKPLNRYLGTGDWGVAIFGKKQNYYIIPDDLKIIYGDNYLLYQNMQNNKQNYYVINLPINHIHSSSSASREFSRVVASDIHNSNKYFNVANKSVEANSAKYEITYNGNVCIIKFTERKTSMFLKYCDGSELYQDKHIRQQLLALMPNMGIKLTEQIIDSIKSNQSKSC